MSAAFVWTRAAAVARKEVFHIARDPFTLALSLGLPVAMVLVYGFAIDFNVKDVALAVSDSDRTQSSRRLIDAFTSAHYFLVSGSASPAQAVRDVAAEKARACLIVPARFEKDLLAGRSARAQVLMDGADNSTVAPVTGYLGAIQDIAARRVAGVDSPRPYELRTRFLFNPELNSRWFVVPGLAVVVMAILSIMLTAMTVAREWETGSMELLLSTPVEPLEVIVGKLAPYAALGLLAQTFIYVMARAIFHVPFIGSLAIFSLGEALFLATYLAQGLWISVATRHQHVAMQFAMLSGMLPSQLLSGFIFPIASMQFVVRHLTVLLPARWFMQLARDCYLKGSSPLELATEFLALAVICAAMVAGATRKFKRDLEP